MRRTLHSSPGITLLTRRWSGLGVLVATLPALVGGCRKAQSPSYPPTQVSVLTIAGQTVPDQAEWVGQASASNTAEVRSQISGIIVQRLFVEGTDVKKGTVLYRIDPRTYLADLRSAEATLAQNRASLANAERTLKRYNQLLPERAVAQQDVDNAQATYDEAVAQLRVAEASVASARKSYEDTFVRAEIDGRVGRALFQIGGLTSGSSDLLTSVERVDPIYVTFNPSDRQLLQWRRDVAAGRLTMAAGAMRVQAILGDGSILPDTGRINFADLAIQQSTGATQLRAEFPNPRRILLPGQYVRVRMLGVRRNDAILVPQRAVQQGLSGPFVYVLGDSNKPVARNVAATAWRGTQWIIESGLRPGDQVVVDGTQKMAPNLPVRPVAYRPDADTTLIEDGDSIIYAPASPVAPTQDSTTVRRRRP